MAFLIYSGQTIAIPDGAKTDQLAEALQNISNSGAYSWLTLDLAGEEPKRVRLLFGPGIPVGIISDQMDGHDVDLTNETIEAFINQAKGGEPS